MSRKFKRWDELSSDEKGKAIICFIGIFVALWVIYNVVAGAYYYSR